MSSSSTLVYPDAYDLALCSPIIDQKPLVRPSSSSRRAMKTSPTATPVPSLRHSPHPIIEPPPHRQTSSSPSNKRTTRRNEDPDRVRRPRNSFFIFRCEFTRKHAEDSKGSERSPTPEKTLSKRAGAIWKHMTDAQKQVYKDLAKQESIEHTQRNPGYRYKPKRTKPTKRRSSGSVSRREQVESLVLKRENEAAKLQDSGSDYSPVASPISQHSSSPEPGPVTPRDAHFPHSSPQRGLAHRRSMSLPHLHMAYPSEPYPFAHTYFIQPESCVSSPGPGPHRTPRRSSSAARQRSYSPNVSIPPPNPAFELQYGELTVPFSALAPHSSTMSLPELLTLPECMALQDAASSTYSTPQFSPAASLHDVSRAEYFAPPPSRGPLFHRRQRSNTAPSATISPLSVVSSTVMASNWNNDSAPLEEATAMLPSLSIHPPDTSEVRTPVGSSVPVPSPLSDGTYSYGATFEPQSHLEASPSLAVPGLDIDIDRTPRRADFPAHIQESYGPAVQYDMSTAGGFTGMGSDPAALIGDPSLGGAPGSSYALDSYVAGLDDFDIAIATYSEVLPFDALDTLDFSEYLC